MISSPIGSSRYIGRDEERRFLRQLFDRVKSSGSSESVLIEGEAGSGKTRLLRELQAESAPATWLTLQPLEYASEPYAPFYLAFCALDQRDTAVARATAALAPDTQVAKARRFADVRAAVRAFAMQKPMVIVFEDAHWADDASIELLRFLIDDSAGAQVFFALTVRTEAHEQRVKAFSHHVHHLRLRPLSDPEILELLREALRGRGELDVQRLRRLSTLAEGNPLLAEELLRNALAGGDDVAPSVHDAVTSRFRALEAVDQSILRVAALLDTIDIEALEAVTDVPDARVREALDAAARADLLQLRNGNWQFIHALTREAIAASIPVDARRAIHRQIAAYIERQAPDSYALGFHWWEAGEPFRAAGANERSGDIAFAAYAFADAATRYRRALEAHTDDARILRRKLASALIKSGDPIAAKPHLIAARAAAEAAGDIEEVCSCDLSISFVRWAEGHADEAIAIARNALQKLEGRPPTTLHFKLAVRVAMASQIKGDVEAARTALEEARPLYEYGDADTRIAFNNTEAMLKAALWDVDGCIGAYNRALRIAEDHEHIELLASTLNNLGLNAVLFGRPDVAMPALERGLREAYENGLRWHVGNTACTLARAHYLFGNLKAARAALLDAMAARYDAPTRVMTFAGYGIPIALAIGDDELLQTCTNEEALEQALQSGLAQFIGPVVDAFARLYATQQRFDDLRAILKRAVDGLHAGERPLFALPHIAHYGDESLGAKAHTLLESPVDDPLRAAERALFAAYSAKRHGDKVAAKRHAFEAATLYREQNWPLFVAEALTVAGRTAEAQQIYRDAGASLAEPKTHAGGVLERLSAREREIAELAIEGLSSREIAARLHLSERTVGNHLQSAFNRLGINNRRELAKLSNSQPIAE